jgi:hypothetical protein
MGETIRQKTFVALTMVWSLGALVFALLYTQLLAVIALPIAIALWFAAHSNRVTQATQLVLPVLLLPGALMCFIGFMQALGYGRMADEETTALSVGRAVFFFSGIALHLAAYWLMASEPRASDHVSGERATKL